jgi:hypothetical protein
MEGEKGRERGEKGRTRRKKAGKVDLFCFSVL